MPEYRLPPCSPRLVLTPTLQTVIGRSVIVKRRPFAFRPTVVDRIIHLIARWQKRI